MMLCFEGRFCDVMKRLTHIILTNTKAKERDEAMAIKKQIKNFDFYACWLCNARFCRVSTFLRKLCSVKQLTLFLLINFCKLLLKTLLNQKEF